MFARTYILMLLSCFVIYLIPLQGKAAHTSLSGQVRVTADSIPTTDSLIKQLVNTKALSAAVTDSAIKQGGKQLLNTPGKALRQGIADASPVPGIKSHLHSLKSLTPEKPKGLKEMLATGKFSVINEGQTARNYFGDGYYYLNNLEINGGIQVAQIPLLLEYRHQDYFYPQHAGNEVFHVKFDRETFINNYKKQLAEKVNIDKLIPKDQVLQQSQKAASRIVKATLDSMQQEYTTMFAKSLPGLDTINDFAGKDLSSLFLTELTAAKAKLIREKETALKALAEKADDTPEIKEKKEKLQQEIDAYHKMMAYYKKYQALRQKLDLAGLNKKLVKETADREQQFEKMMNDPAALKNLAETYLPVSGLQSTFMNMQRMNIGQNTVSLSPLSLYGYLSKGVSMEILKDNKYLFLLVGKEAQLNSIYDRNIFTPLSSNDHVATGIRIGRGGLTENHDHLSVFSFKQNKVSAGGQTFATPSRSAIVIGVNKRMTIDESSNIEVEISKSASVYNDAVYAGDSASRQSALKNLAAGENFAQTLAFLIRYKGSFKERGLDLGFNTAYLASGYYNPGNTFLPAGTKQGDITLKKTWLKKKLILNMKGNFREYSFGGNTNNKWRNYSYLTDLTLRLKGGQQASLKYQPVRGFQFSESNRLLSSGSDRLSADLNLQQRMGTVFYRNAVSTVYNQSRYLLGTVPTNIKSVTLTSMQNLAIDGHLIYLNNTYNKVVNPNGLVYLNSSYNADAGFTYQLGEKWALSSGLNYGSAVGWYRQVGTRHTITGAITRKIDVSLFVDARTNIMQTTDYYDDLLRLDWSVKYKF